jgi:chromate transport protein ChrA
MPTYGILVMFNTNSYLNFVIPYEFKKLIVFLILLTTFIVPTIISFILLNRKVISSIEMEEPKERTLPYIFTIGFYFFTLYLLRDTPLPNVIFHFIIGATIAIITAFIINIKWKISAHMIGIGGMLGALLSVQLFLSINVSFYIILAFIIAGCLGSSRLYLKKHTPMQVYCGFILGLITQLLVIGLMH